MHGAVERLRASVIIASWNAADVLEPCLASLARQEVRGGLETIVVDNASTDGTAAVLRRHAGHVRAIVNDTNAGFSAANNQAAREARGDVLFFLNSDTELLGDDVVEHLAAVAEAGDVGIAGPLLLNPDGTVQASCAAHPGVVRAVLVATGAHRLLPAALRARVAPEHWPHDRVLDTGWVMGAAMAVRASVFAELGGFWPTMYAEDQDLAYRAQQLGLRVRFDPAIRVVHVGNHSLAQRWSDAERHARVARAELAFLNTHYGPVRRTAIRAVVGAGYAARAVAHRLLGRRDRAAVYRAMARVYAPARAR
jgi:N-acetylglucosaminyl-diphospho-decaprenol L-rhamnosyltransferase